MKKTLAAIGLAVIGCISVFVYTEFSERSPQAASASASDGARSPGGSLGGGSAAAPALNANQQLRNSALDVAKREDSLAQQGYTPEERKRLEDRRKLFNQSRTSNDASLRPMLKAAWREGLISESEYYGELAHMLSVSGTEQLSIFSEIVDSKNKYGTEVMFSVLAGNPDWLTKLTTDDRAKIASDLQSIKPVFSGPTGELGMSDVYRYENWIKSFENSYTGKDFNSYLASEIVARAPEPRDYLALSYAGYIDRLRGSGAFPIVAKVDQVLESYKRSYPNNDSSNIILETSARSRK